MPLDLSTVKFPDPMDLQEAAIYLQLSDMRIRALAREGDLKGIKDVDGKWSFKKADLDAFKATPRVRKAGGGKKVDGKAWVIHIKFDQFEKVKSFLAAQGINLEPRYNQDPVKQKAYRAKRAAAKKAEAKAEAAKVAPKK